MSVPVVEIWAPVPGFENEYEASNLGSVRSCDRIVPVKGQSPRFRKGQLLRGSPASKDHYGTVVLKGKSFSVHALVLLAFYGPPLPGQEARHLNGVKSDCRIANLVWATHKENEVDKAAHGTKVRGINHPNSKLTDSQVLEIRKMADVAGKSPSGKLRRHTGNKIAQKFGVSVKYVYSIIKGTDRKL